MTLGIQVLAAHPWAGLYLAQLLASDPTLARRLADPPVIELDASLFQEPPEDEGDGGRQAAALPKATRPRLFVVDTHFLPLELPQLTRLLRVRCPRSRFVVLLPAQSLNDETCLRLLYLGIEGVLGASEKLGQELPAAVRAVSAGNLWAPARVLSLYKQQTAWIRSKEFKERFSITARENQVLQMMLRRLSNKEIGGALGISERTVKFHVSNILSKLRLDNRERLPAVLTPAPAGETA